MPYRSGRHFLQIPGPTNVPERVRQAIASATIDHRGPQFAKLALGLLADLKRIFQTEAPIVIYPSSGTGAWEAALANTLSPGDRILMVETGQFANLWCRVAQRLGLDVDYIAGDWRHGVDPHVIEAKLSEDSGRLVKAVAIVHNETSTGVVSEIPEVRAAIDRAGHPALLLVDVISSLGSIDYRHDEWGVDVTVACSQKGLMVPPGLSFTAISAKALAASKQAQLPRAYWDWQAQLDLNPSGFFPYTPATNLLYGLREALNMLFEEGLQAVFARHGRHAEATRRAVEAWGLVLQSADRSACSNSITAVRVPEGHNADKLRELILERFDMSLGSGLGKVRGLLFRIGHLGDFNDLMLMGTLAGVEMGLDLAGIPFNQGGVEAAMDYLVSSGRTAA